MVKNKKPKNITLPSGGSSIYILISPEVRRKAVKTATVTEAGAIIEGLTTEVAEAGTIIPARQRNQVSKEHVPI